MAENTGTDGADTLYGTANADLIQGLGGDDKLYGWGSADTLKGGAGNDYLDGGSGNDSLIGGSGNDSLAGGTGADSMSGGTGNDTYYVDNPGDYAGEVDVITIGGLIGGGIDTVYASLTHTLTINLENLALTGLASINGTGNAKANLVRGNGADNVLSGLGNADTLEGRGGRDTLYGGSGNDSLDGGAGNDYVRGQGGDDTLDGGNDNDNVEGGTGTDYLYGGSGNDTLSGGDGSDGLWGDDGADHLNGSGGNDGLYAGVDSTEDRFYFTTPLDSTTNLDTLFNAEFGEDQIMLDNDVFTAVRSGTGFNIGTLGSAYYFKVAGPGPTVDGLDDAPGIYYDTDTGILYYNPLANVIGDTVAFAVIDGAPASLSHLDFTLIA